MSAAAQIRRGGYILVLLGFVSAGCAGPNYHAARTDFYAGRLDKAEERLAEAPSGKRNMVLFLMERGTVLQAAKRYEESTRDWLQAVKLCRELEPMSVSQQGSSLLVNDNTVAFRGKPFERTLLRTFLAKNYLARSMWQDAGVEARNIIYALQRRNDYPDDAYSRYMAGLCLEVLHDYSNARMQYREANELSPLVVIGEDGRLSFKDAETDSPGKDPALTHELVCFIAIGRSPTGRQSLYGNTYVPKRPPYAEIYAGDRLLGRSYPLTDTASLINDTFKRQAAGRLAKDAARITTKAVVAHQIKQHDEGWGALAELVLFSMESPDVRRWETLPRWLQVARVPCPQDLSNISVVFKNRRGTARRTVRIQDPVPRNGKFFVAFCRDLPPPVQRPAKSTK